MAFQYTKSQNTINCSIWAPSRVGTYFRVGQIVEDVRHDLLQTAYSISSWRETRRVTIQTHKTDPTQSAESMEAKMTSPFILDEVKVTTIHKIDGEAKPLPKFPFVSVFVL